MRSTHWIIIIRKCTEKKFRCSWFVCPYFILVKMTRVCTVSGKPGKSWNVIVAVMEIFLTPEIKFSLRQFVFSRIEICLIKWVNGFGGMNFSFSYVCVACHANMQPVGRY